MKPVQEMLSRIRWDKNWADDEFKIGYYDRVEQRIIIVPFKEIIFPKDEHFSFEVIDQQGESHSVPYHRVKAIYQNGRLIWHREVE
ncbi:MAG: DUF504 domain-containing protein [Methylomicrobium sp.]